jgi:peroxiredoxin
MKSLTYSLLAALLGLFSLSMPAHAANPEATFSDFDGNQRTIESFIEKEKWLVVMIWAHDCHVCNMEAENYAHFHEANKDRNITMLGISIDGQANRKKALGFIEEHDLPFPNLIGEPEAVMRYYMRMTGNQFVGTPTIMIYNPDGALAAAQAGGVPPEVIAKFVADNS